jgi:Ferritin-like domain
MPDHITLEVVDVDGAIQETGADAGLDTRAGFFKKAAMGGGALIGGGVLLGGFPAMAGAQTKSAKNDVKILNYALTLEYLESEFYAQAIKNGSLTGDVLDAAKVVSEHEDAHVAFLKKALGKAAVKKPTFDFKDTVTDSTKFLTTAVALEDTGVSAYAGQAAKIFSPKVLAAAATILPVEARHASRFRALQGSNFAPRAFDKANSMKKTLDIVGDTGFIKA